MRHTGTGQEDMKSWMRSLARSRHAGLVWLAVSAVLFLLGASVLDGQGSAHLASIGVGGAIAAVAVMAAFF